MRCFVTISTLRRTECQLYGWPWSRVNSSVTVFHHLQRLLRWPNSSAWWLQMSKRETSSLVVRRLPCLRASPPPPSPPPLDRVWLLRLWVAGLRVVSRSSPSPSTRSRSSLVAVIASPALLPPFRRPFPVPFSISTYSGSPGASNTTMSRLVPMPLSE